ncbi:MAG: cytochrome D1 domain-containing protein [Vicinamibacterales bacterium]
MNRGHALAAALWITAALVCPAAAQQPSTLLVVNKLENTLAFVDPATGQVAVKVPTGEGPHEVVTDGTYAYVGNYGAQTPGSTLSVIDLASRKEVRRVDLGALRRPHGLVMAEGKVYFTAETNRVVARYDPAADRVDWVMGTGQAGTHMIVAHGGGATFFTTNIGSDTVSVISRGANPLAWAVTTIAVGKGPEAIDISPEGAELWVAHSRDGGVSVVDIATRKVAHTFDLRTKRSNRLTFTPDGALVLISDLDGGALVVVDARTRAEVKRLPLGRSPEGILVAPDGGRAYVAVTGDNAVAVIDLSTLTVLGRIPTGAAPDGMAWVGR